MIMAEFFENKNPMAEKYAKHKKIGIPFMTIGLCFFALWVLNVMVFHTFNPFFLVPVFFGVAIFGGIGAYNLNKAHIIGVGAAGKATARNYLSELPDTYTVLTNRSITYQGKTSVLDTVIVGETGIFVLLTKNQNGTVTGRYSDQNFTQHKVGQKGTPYTNQFYNPIKQVSTHVFRLSGVLKEYGIKSWIQGIVYFSNPETTVEVSYDSVPVFAESDRGGSEVCSYILTYPAKRRLTPVEVQKIVGVLA